MSKKYPKVVVGVIGDLSSMPPKDAEMVAKALACAARMLNEADHEKIERQYRAGVLSQSTGFSWYVPQEGEPKP